MFLGQVIGSVWGARQAPGLAGPKLLKVRPLTLRPAEPGLAGPVGPEGCAASDRVIVAADGLGAGPGEYVVLATGSRVRDVAYDTARPFKAVVVAIVDGASIDLGEVS